MSLHHLDCRRKLFGKEPCADRAGCPGKRCDAVPGDFQLQPRRGGALLADRGVVRRSLYIDMAHSSLLVLGQNRLRHDVQM
jgi:hypothetical protein